MTEFKRNDPRHRTGADVEIVEVLPASADAASMPVIKVCWVYVNGTPVGLLDADDGIEVEFDPKQVDATKLRLTLYPRTITVRAVNETPERTVFSADEIEDQRDADNEGDDQ